MRTIVTCATTLAFAGILLAGSSLYANTLQEPAVAKPDQSASMPVDEHAAIAEKQMSASAIATQAWLEKVDNHRYGESWDAASVLLKRTVSKKEWERILDATRNPLGGVTKRQLIQQLPAQNPKHMPRGDYMVMLYQTQFSTKSARELLTLSYEYGEWKVITYNVN